MGHELRLYQSSASPNARRVRIYLAERGISAAIVPVEFGAGEQFSDAYAAINSRHVVPTLVLADGTAIGEVQAIFLYLDETHRDRPIGGVTPRDRALVAMWEWRMEQEGFAAVMEAVSNDAGGLAGRVVEGPYGCERIPALVKRGSLRVRSFHAGLEARLTAVAFVAGDLFSTADITAAVAIDFAGEALSMPIPDDHSATRRWYDAVSARPGFSA